MKRFLSVLLIICMLCPLFGAIDMVLSADAADNSDYVWTVYNDDDPRIAYSGAWGWFTETGFWDNYFGNSVNTTTQKGATATLTFNGVGVRYYAVTNGAGVASDNIDVYIDGEFKKTVSIVGGLLDPVMPFEITGLESGEHTIQLVNNTEGSEGMYIDYFEVACDGKYTRIDDHALTYKNRFTDSDLSGIGGTHNGTLNAYVHSAVNNEVEFFEYTFTGTGVRLGHRFNGDGAWFKVSVDGSEPVLYNTFEAKPANWATTEQVNGFCISGLDYGTHTIKVSTVCLTGGRNIGWFDYIDIIDESGFEWIDVDDDDTRISYSGAGWSEFQENAPFGGAIHITYNSGDSATLKFNGGGVRFHAMVHDAQFVTDKVEIYLDGEKVKTVNLQSTGFARSLVYEAVGLEEKEHTITVKNCAPTSGGTGLTVDYFQVLGTVEENDSVSGWIALDDTDSSVEYIGSGWSIFNESRPYGGGIHISYTVNDSAKLTFSGIGVRFHAMHHNNTLVTDNAEIWLDGNKVETVNLIDADFTRFKAYEITGLEDKEHTLEIKNGRATISGTQNGLTVDYFEILPGGATDESEYVWSIVNNDDSRLVYSGGGWYQFNEYAPFGGSVHDTYGINNTVSLTFKGVGIRYYAMNNAHLYSTSMAKVYVDGVFQKFVDLTSDDGSFKRSLEFELTGLADTVHTITIKNVPSTVSGQGMNIDYFEVATVDEYERIDDHDSRINYVNRTHVFEGVGGTYEGTLSALSLAELNKDTKFFTYTFTGSGLRLGTRTNGDGTVFKVSVDGAEPIIFNTFDNALSEQKNTFCINGLANMEHTVEVYVYAPQAGRVNAWLDYMDIFIGGKEAVSLESASAVNAENWIVQLKFSEPVNIPGPQWIYLCNQINPNAANNWASGDWQSGVNSIEYINGENINGKEYSDTVNITFNVPDAPSAPLWLPEISCVRICEYNAGAVGDWYIPSSIVIGKGSMPLGANRSIPGSDVAFAEIDFTGINTELLSVENIGGNIKAQFNHMVKFAGLDTVKLEVGDTEYNCVNAVYSSPVNGYSDTVTFSFDYSGDISQAKLVISDNGQENGLIEKAVAENYHGGLLIANTSDDKIVKAVNPAKDETIEVGKDLSSEIQDGKSYSLMNADTGRYFGTANTFYFTFKAKEGTNRYSIYDEAAGKYLQPDGSLASEEYIYIITEASGGRYKIKSTNGVYTLKDNDSGASNVAVCKWGKADNYIENLWFATLKGEEEPLKVMPLGDSITYGINQDVAYTDQTGNTPFLSDMLLKAEETNGRIITVGSVKPKIGYETDTCLYRNEGHPGWLAHNEYAYVSNMGQAGLDEYIDGWMAKYTPDVICMQIGTNDCGYLHSDLPEVKSYEETFKGWENLVDQILNNMSEDDLLIAATPTPHGSNIVLDGTYKEWGLSEKEYVNELIAAGEDRIVMADNFNYILRYAGRTEGTCSDDLHLSQLGYEKMGENYYKTIMKALFGVDLFEEIVPLTLDKAELLNESSILLTFSDDIVVDGSPFVAMRLVDDNDSLVWDGEKDNSTPMQFYGSMYPYNNSKNQYVWVMSGSDQNTYGVNNIYDLLEYVGIENFKQYDLKFCIEETTSGDAKAFPFDDHIANIYRENADGSKEYLSATRSVRESLDDVYITVEGEFVVEYPEIVSATAINASQIKVKFSEPVEFISNPFMALRFIDENGNLAWDGIEGQGGTPLQWEVKYAFADEKQDTVIFTIDALYYGVSNLTELMNYEGGLAKFKDMGYTLVLAMEDLPNDNNPVQYGNGRIEAVASKQSGNRLGANRAEYFDKLYYEFDVDYDPKTITLKSATAINASQIVLEFSDDIVIKGTPYMAVRMVDENGKLVWDGEVNNSTPMQWSGKYEYYKGDKSKLIFTMNEPTYEVLNITELINYKNMNKFKDYSFKFCIEETQPGIIPSNSLVENIANAKGQYLEGNLLNPASLDGVYMDIKIDYETDQLDIISAEVVNQYQILVSFNNSVEIGQSYIAVRLIDGNKNLMWTGAPDKSIPLQFDGTWEYANEAQTQILWTMNGDNNRATKNLVDVLTYGGLLGEYNWCNIAFCIEEGGSDIFLANGLVDTVSNYSGMVLDGNKYTPGGADRIYEYLTVGIDLEKSVEMTEAVAINETQIVVTFSEPVSIGDKGKEPSMSVRYTDHFGYMVWSGEKYNTTPMEWNGSWDYYNDEHTQIIFTLEDDTMGATNITEIINFAGKLKRFEGSKVEFCIEELPENDKNNQGNNRLVCNVRDAKTGIYELAATLKGNRDGTYMPFSVDYDASYTEPVEEEETETVPTETVVVPYSYLWVYITGGVIVLAGAVLAMVLKKKNK